MSANKTMSLKELVDEVKKTDLEILFSEKWIDLLYGMPGSGKSMLIALLSMWLWVHKRQKTRWIIGDGGFQTVQNLGLVSAGAVEVCEYAHRPEPGTTIELLSEGWWPGNVQIAGTPFTKLEPPKPESIKDVNLWVFEGFGVAAQYLMSNVQGGFAHRAAAGEKMGVEAVVKMDDKIDVGAKRSHATQTGWSPYNMAQTILMGCKRRSETLPHVIWTTHERDGEDKVNNNETWIGPEVAGKALTTKLAGMFGNTFHCVQVQRKTQGVDAHSQAKVHKVDTIRRVWTSNHFDAEGQVQRQYVGNCRTYGVQEYYDLVTPADGLKLWADLARLKREAKDALGALSA